VDQENDIPSPPLSDNFHYSKAMDSIRAFELQQMSFFFFLKKCCSVCCERGLDLWRQRMFVNAAIWKNSIKMFSSDNNMGPGPLPPEFIDLTFIQQQLNCRITPRINAHMLNHGGIASSGHCVTFSQEIHDMNQPKFSHIYPQEIYVKLYFEKISTPA
jgi:hypothetical protein